MFLRDGSEGRNGGAGVAITGGESLVEVECTVHVRSNVTGFNYLHRILRQIVINSWESVVLSFRCNFSSFLDSWESLVQSYRSHFYFFFFLFSLGVAQ